MAYSKKAIYNTESAGILKVTDSSRDVRGEHDAGYYWRVYDGGRVLSTGEPRVVPTQSYKYPFIDAEKTHELWTVTGFKNVSVGRYNGAVWILNPAMIDEGYNNKDPLYADDVVAQRRGPWVLAFDNRNGTLNPALSANDTVTDSIFKTSSSGLLLPDYSGFNLGYMGEGGFVPLHIPNQLSQQMHWTGVRRELEKDSNPSL